MKILPAEFEGQAIRRIYDEASDAWWFSVTDVVQVLSASANARRYWSDLKRKPAQEAGSEQPYEKIVRLKLPATDGKLRETDCASAATLLRIVQSIPSPKAEPITLWLAQGGAPPARTLACRAPIRVGELESVRRAARAVIGSVSIFLNVARFPQPGTSVTELLQSLATALPPPSWRTGGPVSPPCAALAAVLSRCYDVSCNTCGDAP